MRISDEALSYAKEMNFNEQIVPLYWQKEWHYLYEVRDSENIDIVPMQVSHFFGSIEQRYIPLHIETIVHVAQITHEDMKKFIYYYIDFSLRYPEYFVKKKYIVRSGDCNRFIVVATHF